MALQIIDRRLAGKNKSVGNRERFVRRYKEQIADAVRRAVSQRGIRDMEQAESITIPRKDISEPVFHHGQGGIRDTVHPGNAEHVRGDRIERPQGGAGGRGSQASDSGEGDREIGTQRGLAHTTLAGGHGNDVLDLGQELHAALHGMGDDLGGDVDRHVVHARHALGGSHQAAAQLGINRNTLHKKLKEYDLE